jgi:hypothetical protein
MTSLLLLLLLLGHTKSVPCTHIPRRRLFVVPIFSLPSLPTLWYTKHHEGKSGTMAETVSMSAELTADACQCQC